MSVHEPHCQLPGSAEITLTSDNGTKGTCQVTVTAPAEGITLSDKTLTLAIVSMNPIMVDGTGMCGACRLKVGDEIKFACVDGPEFDGHLVDFDQAMKRSAMYRTEEGRAMLKLQEGDTHHGGCGQCN